MTSLIQCTGIWVSGGAKYGLSWKLVQAMITELPQNSRNFTFVDDGEVAPRPSSRKPVAAPLEDEEEEEEFVPPPRKAAPVKQVEEEEEEEEADDVEPIPVPKTKKLLPKKVPSKPK
jgi:hypothetical protein